MRTLPTAILALAVCCAGTASATDVYRWTDEKGVTHYSDTPPGDRKTYERVNVRTGKASAPETTAETNDNAGEETAQPIQAQVDPAVRAERCQTAQRNLLLLRSDIEVAGEVDGETRTLTTEEREKQIAQNERVVANNCDTP